MIYKKEKDGTAKKRIGITLVDVLILVLIVFLCVVAYRFVFTETEDEAYTVSYVIKVTEVRDELSDRITVGDEVYTDGGVYMGRVRAYEVTGAVSALNGQTIPGLYDLYVTVEAESSDPDEVLINGISVKVEGEYSLRTAEFSFGGVCISIGK